MSSPSDTAATTPPAGRPASPPTLPDHQVWLSVWWPDVEVDVTSATAADLPEDVDENLFAPVPQVLRPAVAYALLSAQIGSFTDPARTRDAVGFALPGGQQMMAVPVSMHEAEDEVALVALFTVDLDTHRLPACYTFSSWASLEASRQLIEASHRTAPGWAGPA